MTGDHLEVRVKYLVAAIDALDRLFIVANDLKRTNHAKWSFRLSDWQTATSDCLFRIDEVQDDKSEAMKLDLRSAVRRLANSGEARYQSASVGRNPNSSDDGRRFHEDLVALESCASDFRDLVRVESV